MPITAIALCAVVPWHAPCLGAPGQLIAGGAGARPDLNGHAGTFHMTAVSSDTACTVGSMEGWAGLSALMVT
jgi:hypothetical protein